MEPGEWELRLFSHPMRKSLPAPITLLRQRVATRLIEQDTDNSLPIAIPVTSIDEGTRTLLLKDCQLAECADKEYLLYIPSINDIKAMAGLKGMHQEVEKLQASNQGLLQELGMTLVQVEGIQRRHINLLHKYNEIKDVVQAMMGVIAQHRGMRTAELYDAFELDLDD